jgi:AcrR family transcriptional regulator
MNRTYTLKRRAKQQAETRQRIVEAAFDLHTSIGPARTTISMIAARAGVQRHTVYAHFPDDRDLFQACSGLANERDPLPDAAPWRDISEPCQRLRTGLAAIYDWYERNASLAACVLRDAETHELTRQTVEKNFAPSLSEYLKVLGEGLDRSQRGILRLAVSYYTWRTLTQEYGLDGTAAAEAIIRAIVCAADP